MADILTFPWPFSEPVLLFTLKPPIRQLAVSEIRWPIFFPFCSLAELSISRKGINNSSGQEEEEENMQKQVLISEGACIIREGIEAVGDG